MKMISWICFMSILVTLVNWSESVTLDDDPSLWPGHMEPYASKQTHVNIEVLAEWPSPLDFFEKFLDKSRPALFKGLAKNSPAYKLWDDEYLANHPGSDKEMVYCEPEKKENRTKAGKEVTLKEFINIYKKDSIYMVNGVPPNIQKDVLMPPPLRCEETRKYMLDAVTWFSSGGTKSVIHADDLDNINCLFRGSKKLIFVEPKYRKYVPLDIKNGGYSSVDVDKVNFTKYPSLRQVEQYVIANMEEGDCLFIPFRWIHQVNSVANEKGQNVAVNIWFQHTKNHRPKTCTVPEAEATIDKFKFRELEKLKTEEGAESENEVENEDEVDPAEMTLAAVYEGYLEQTKKKRANFKTFYSLLMKDPSLFDQDITEVELPSSFEQLAKELFNTLDVTQNGVVNVKDFDMADTEEHREDFDTALEKHHTNLKSYIDDFFAANDKGMSPEEIEKQTDSKSARLDDEL